jgi:hypothetical protein
MRRMTPISLIAFLQSGAFGPYVPVAGASPEAVFAALGPADQVYNPNDPDRPYVPGDADCFPLIVAYGDVEFHFESPASLVTVFVDSFSGPNGAACGGPLTLTEAGLLCAETPMPRFLDAAPQHGIAIRSVRPHAPPYAFVVTTEGGVEVGFEHDDPDEPGSVAGLKWFCWTPRAAAT